MNLRAIRLLHLRGLRARPLRTALATLAVGAGVALLVGVLIADHSLRASLRAFTDAVNGPSALRVEGPVDHGGLDESALPKVAGVDGVQAAVPLVLTITQAVDGDGDVILIPAIGVDCGIEAITGTFGCTLELLQALQGGPAIGRTLRRQLGSGGMVRTDLREIPVGDAPVVDALGAINDGRVALFDLSAAQREFVRPAGLDTILVVPAPGVSETELAPLVQRAVGEHNEVIVGTSAPLASSLVAQVILPFMFLISLVGLLIGAQLVRNTIELSLEERRRELATSAALGSSPRAQLTGTLAEAVVIGVAGGIVGLVLGTFVASAFVAALSDQLARATGLHVDVSVQPIALGVGVLVGVVVCLAASIGPARRTSRRDLATELSERGRYEPPGRRGRLRVALLPVAAVVTVGLAWVAHQDGSLREWQPPLLIGALVLSLVVGFQAPGLMVLPVLRLLRRSRLFATGPPRVALDELLSVPKRTGSMAAAISAPVVMAVILSSIVPGLTTAARRFAEEGSGGTVYVSTLKTNNSSSIDAKPTPDLQRAVAAQPQVARVDRWIFAVIKHPSVGLMELAGVEGTIPDFHVHRGMDGPTAIAAGKVMIGPRLARDKSLEPGDRFTVPGRFGPVTLTIGGIWASPSGIGRGIMTTIQVQRVITGERPPDRLQVVPVPGTSPEELAEELRDVGFGARVLVLDPAQLASDYGGEFEEIISPFWTMQRGILLVALVATASTLLLAGLQRRREIALLAALGMGPADVARSTVLSTLLLGVTATAASAVAAQVQLVCFAWGSEVLTGLGLPYRPQVGGIVVAGLSAVLVALVGTALPAWRASRGRPRPGPSRGVGVDVDTGSTTCRLRS